MLFAIIDTQQMYIHIELTSPIAFLLAGEMEQLSVSNMAIYKNASIRFQVFNENTRSHDAADI